MTRLIRSGTTALLAVLLFATAAPAAVQAQYCDAYALRAALSAAGPGSTVRVGNCRLVGPFEVPEGVILRGTSRGASVVVAPAGGTAVRLAGGSVSGLTVESDAQIGIHVLAAGGTVTGVRVVATRGVGIAAERARVDLDDVTVSGPVTPGNVRALGSSPGISSTALYGVVIVRGSAVISSSRIQGFATSGVTAVGASLEITGTRIDGNAGNGLTLAGGDAYLSDVDVTHTLRGARAADDIAGVIVSDGARVSSHELTSARHEGVGVLHIDSGCGSHSGLAVRSNARGGVLLESSGRVSITDAAFTDNDQFGLAAIESDRVSLRSSRITATGLSGGFGDGIQLVGTPASLDDVVLRANQRIGLLVELGESMSLADLRLRGVDVVAPGGALGALFQQAGSLLPLVTAGIHRNPPTTARDAAQQITIRVYEGVPVPSSLVAVEALAQQGLGALFGPNGPF